MQVCCAHFAQHIMQHNAIPPHINSVHGCLGLSCMAIHVHVEFVHARGTPVQLSLPGVGTVDGHSAMVSSLEFDLLPSLEITNPIVIHFAIHTGNTPMCVNSIALLPVGRPYQNDLYARPLCPPGKLSCAGVPRACTNSACTCVALPCNPIKLK